jgi:hypothetical protein
MNVKKIRDHAVLNISPQTAAASGMAYADLTQFICGRFFPSESQLRALAAWLRMREEDFT